jgi:hypothetical protein
LWVSFGIRPFRSAGWRRPCLANDGGTRFSSAGIGDGQLKTKHHLEVDMAVATISEEARERIGLAEPGRAELANGRPKIYKIEDVA